MAVDLKELTELTVPQSHSQAKKPEARRRAEGPGWEGQQRGLQGHLPLFIQCPLVADYRDASRLAGAGAGAGGGGKGSLFPRQRAVV